MQGRIHKIFIADSANSKPISLTKAELIAGKGIKGDRYYKGTGTFSEMLAGKPLSELTLIAKERVDEFNQQFHFDFSYAEFRRNLITERIELNQLVDKTFYIGDVELLGIKLCEPCPHLAALLTPQVLPSLTGKAGLRAQILNGGTLQINQTLSFNR